MVVSIQNGHRLLMIKEILLNETDEEHELCINDIVAKLQLAFGVDYKVDPRAIKQDLALLNHIGFEINENPGKYGKIFYSHQSHLFETYQLRLLIDSILSARFITNQEKHILVSKLKSLTSRTIAKSLPNPFEYNQSINENYQMIKLHIDKIHRAINKSKMIAFQYGIYNVEKDFCLRKNGEQYIIKPYALIWESDFYYLIGEHIRHNNLSHYRLDRMRNLDITDHKFVKKSLDVSHYVKNTFQMFGGEDGWIKIKFFNKALINPMIDKFGLNVNITIIDENTFVLTTKAKMSRGLINWILSWGDEAQVISPSSLVKEVTNIIQKLDERYKQ